MEDILRLIDISNLPTVATTLLFVYYVVVRDADKRLNGLSAYIKRFLALYRASVHAQQASTDAMLQLSEAVRLCNNHANAAQPQTEDDA